MNFTEEDDKKSLILALGDGFEVIALERAMEEVKAQEKATGKVYNTKDLRDKVHAWATNYASDLVNGLNATTNEAVAELTRAKNDGELTAQEFDDMLANVFADYRAEVISATETTVALSKGVILASEVLGNMLSVYWQTEEDEAVDEDCLENQDAGILPIGSTFPSGHTEPPAHPNCRCTLIPIYS